LMLNTERRDGRLCRSDSLKDGKDDQSQEIPHAEETHHVWTAAWIRSETRSYQPSRPVFSICNNTKYLRKKRWLKRHTTIKGRLPHPPVLSATADLAKSHANKDAAVRTWTTVKMLLLRHHH
jgi:hypothetical protein